MYNQILTEIAGLFDGGHLAKPPVKIAGTLSVATVQKAHQLLDNNLVQGKLVMTC